MAHLNPGALKQRERGKEIVPFSLDIFGFLTLKCVSYIVLIFFSLIIGAVDATQGTSGMLNKYPATELHPSPHIQNYFLLLCLVSFFDNFYFL